MPPPAAVAADSLDTRGQQLAARTIDRLEQLLSDTAVSLVNSLARARKVSPHHLALGVPGLCHSHGPDRRLLDRRLLADGPDPCAYCRRRGNCFAGQ